MKFSKIAAAGIFLLASLTATKLLQADVFGDWINAAIDDYHGPTVPPAPDDG